MKKLIITSAFFLFCTTSISALTIQESIKLATKNNPSVHEAEHNIDISRESYNQIVSENYPTFFANGKLVKAKTTSRTTNYVNESTNSLDYTLGVKQNLFNGYSTTNRLDYQMQKVHQENKELYFITEDITYNVLVAYYNIIKNKKLVKVEKNNIEVISKLYEEISQSQQSGFAVLSDVKKVDAALQNAKYNLLVQQNELDRWIRALEYFTLESIKASDINEQDINTVINKDLEEAINIALENNPKIQSLVTAIKAQSYMHKSTDAWKYPTVDVVLDHSKTGDHDSLIGDTKQTQLYLNVDYKFSFGDEHKHKANKELFTLKKLQQQLLTLKNQIKRDVTNVWEKIDSLEKQINHLEYYFIHTSATIDLYKQEFDVGSRDLIDLLSAQTEYVSSEKNLISAQYDSKILGFERMYLTGNIQKPVSESKIMEQSDFFKEFIFSNSYYDRLMDPQNKDKFIIHLAVYKYENNLKKLIENNKLHENIYGFTIDNTKLVKLVHGIFNTKKEAQNYLKKYAKKDDINENKPYITTIQRVQKMIHQSKGDLK